MVDLSLCMIVKNEEHNLARCLSSVRELAEEIIVVDTGSNDQTVEIARHYGAQVFSFPWKDDFSAARNFSLSQASGEWILLLDADEELASADRSSLNELLECSRNHSHVEGYFLKIINYIGNTGWIESCADLVFRLFRNRQSYRFHGAIHEQIADVILSLNPEASLQVAEEIQIIHYGYLDQEVEHRQKKQRNLSILQKELESQPGDLLLRYHYGVELFRAQRYLEAIQELTIAADTLSRETIYYPKLLRYIVLSQQAAGLPDAALSSINTGLGLYPDYADLYYYGGLVHLDLKHYALARTYFQQAISMPEQPLYYASFGGVRGYRSLYHLGQIYEVFSNYEAAIGFYLASLQDNPGFIPAMESLTKLLDPHLDPEYACSCLKKALDLSDPRASRLMGEILFRQEAYGLALSYFHYAAELLPSSPETRLQTAICLIQEHRYFEGLQVLNTIPPTNPLQPLVLINQLLASGLQGETRQVCHIQGQLNSLQLAPDTINTLSLLVTLFNPWLVSTAQGNPEAAPVALGPEGAALLLEVSKRLLFLRQIELADFLWHSVTPGSLAHVPELLLNLAQAYSNFDCFAQATQLSYIALETCLQPQAHLLLAEIFKREGQYFRALHHYRWALAAAPHEPQPYLKLIDLYRSWQLAPSLANVSIPECHEGTKKL